MENNMETTIMGLFRIYMQFQEPESSSGFCRFHTRAGNITLLQRLVRQNAVCSYCF